MDYTKPYLKFLHSNMIMTGTTVSAEQPWVFNAFYVADDKSNVYWVSHNVTRHAGELKENPKMAIAIYDKAAMPGSIKGVQMSGDAVELSYDEAIEVLKMYQAKYSSKTTAEDLEESKTKRIYRFTPNKIMFRDSESFEDRVEIKL